MTAVTVTSPIGATCHYWFSPQAIEASSTGVTVPDIIQGWLQPGQALSLSLDDAYLWDINMNFRNAPPIVFDGFAPSDGDLLTLLSAQGWEAL